MSNATEEIPGAHGSKIQTATVAGFSRSLLVPFTAYPLISPALLAGKIVMDANSYYPERDGNILELDRRNLVQALAAAERDVEVAQGSWRH